MSDLKKTLARRLAPVIFCAVLLAAWHFAARLQRTALIPGPWPVASGIIELAERGLLGKYVVASLFRVTWGYLLAVVSAIPLGLVLGWNRRAGMAFDPSLQILRPISPLAWIPLAILWFGVGDLAAVFLIFLASFLPLTVTAMNAVRNIPSIHLDAGRNFGLSQRQLVYKVLYPAVLPKLIVGLRLALGIAWLVVVAAEMVAVNSGLGFLIIDARNAGNRYDLVIAGMVLIGVIGLLLDVGFRRLERLPALRWGYGTN
jgi:NitT/TauT family transport system permease protein